MRARAHVAAVLVLVVSSSATRRADADDARDPVAAEALFVEGRKLVADGQVAAACPKFEASHRLDPAIGTLLNLADCYERLGRVATAWLTFRTAEGDAQRAGRSALEKVAHDHLTKLEPRLPRIAIVVAPGDDAVTVRRDGIRVDRATYGQALPVDPGAHRVEALRDGKVAWSTTIDVAERDRRTVDIPRASAAPPNVTKEEPPARGGPARWSTLRWTGVGVAGAGLVAAGIGTVLALNAKSAWDDSRPMCQDDLCTPDGKRLADKALDEAHAATVAFVASGALVACGAVLFVVGGTSRDVGVGAWPGGVLVSFRY